MTIKHSRGITRAKISLCLAGALLAAASHAHAQGASNIDTSQPFFLGSGLGTTVNPAFQGGTLRVDQSNAVYMPNFTLSGSPTNTIDQNGNNSTFSGVFSDAVTGTPGNLTIVNSGTGGSVTLTQAATYTGATTVASGATLNLIATYPLTTAASAFTVNGTLGGTSGYASLLISSLSGSGVVNFGSCCAGGLTLTNASGIFSGTITGAGSFGVDGGTETLSGTNTYQGITGIAPGATLALAGTGSIASSLGVLVDGTLDISGTTTGATIASINQSNVSLHGAIVLGGQTLSMTEGGIFYGSISGTGGLALTGGSLELVGSSTYSGGTTVSNATLVINQSAALGAASGALTLNQATLTVSGGLLNGGDVALSGNVALSGSNTINTGGQSVSLAGVVSGAGGLTLTGGGILTLSQADTYSGQITIDSSVFNLNPYGSTTTLALSGGGSLGAASLLLVAGYSYQNTRSAFDISATTAGASIASIAGNGTVALGGQTLTIADANGTFAGKIIGTGGLAITGGTQTLNGANTYSGLTTISPGATLALGLTGGIAASAGVLADGTLDLTASANIGIATLSGSGSVIVGDGLILNNASGTFSGTITGTPITAGGTTGLGPITPDLSGTYVGGFNSIVFDPPTFAVTGGTEVVSGAITIGSVSVGAGAKLALTGGSSLNAQYGLVSNGTFDVSASNASTSIGTLIGTGLVALNGQTLTITNAGHIVLVDVPSPPIQFPPDDLGGDICSCDTFTFGPQQVPYLTYDIFSGTITGAGGVAITGGMEMLSGTNTYAGGTTVTNAVLGVNSDAAMGAGSGGLTLNNGQLVAFAPFSSSRAVTITGTGTIDTNLFAVALTGPIGGGGGLTVTGGGTLTLTGTNTYGGGTSVFDTNLAVGGDTALGATSGGLALTDATLTALANLNSARSVTLANADTIATGGNAVTLSGTVNGSGSLTVAGGGQLTLTSINTYTGATTINAGTSLALNGAGSIAGSSSLLDNGAFDISAASGGVSITALSGTGAIALGSRTLTLNGSGTFSGAIAGTGGLNVAGGTQALTGVNTYSGGTAVTNATLAINADAALGGPSSGIVLSNATLMALQNISSPRAVTMTGANTVNTAGAAVTLSGILSGPGSLTASGGGQLTLTAPNLYAGGTRITGGTTLAIASDTALGAPSGGLLFDNGTLLALASFATARAISTTTGGGTIDPNGFTVSLTGPIILEGALTTSGAGVVSFGGGAQLGGVLTVSGNTFSANDILDATAVIVSSTGTLHGIGTINAPTTVYGTLAPGNSPGTLTFTAPVTLAPGSTTQFDIDGTGTGTGAGNYSRILVTGANGTVTAGGTLLPLLRGITGSASNTYTPPIAQSFQVITADSGLTGSFSGLVQPAGLGAGTRFDTLYEPTTLTLVVTPGFYGNLTAAGISETGDQAAAGAALDAIRPVAGVRPDASSAALFDPLYALAATAIPGALDQLGPSIYGDALNAARDSWRQMADQVMEQLAARRGAGTANTAPGPNGSTIWVSGVGQLGHTGGANAPGYHVSSGGAMAGIDLPINNFTIVGLALGGGTVTTSAGDGATATGNTGQIALYGELRSGPWFLDAQAAYAHTDEDVRRNLTVWDTTARGATTINGGGVQVRGGSTIEFGRWHVEPALGLSVTNLASQAANETTGGALALRVGEQSLTAVQSLAEVRINTQFDLAEHLPIHVHAVLGWTHEFDDLAALTTASFGLPGASPFAVASAPASRDAAIFGAGFDVTVTRAVSLYGAYAASAGRAGTMQDLTAGLRVTW